LVVAAIKASRLPFSEGIAVEQALARQSLASEESRVLRSNFFAERRSRKSNVDESENYTHRMG